MRECDKNRSWTVHLKIVHCKSWIKPRLLIGLWLLCIWISKPVAFRLLFLCIELTMKNSTHFKTTTFFHQTIKQTDTQCRMKKINWNVNTWQERENMPEFTMSRIEYSSSISVLNGWDSAWQNNGKKRVTNASIVPWQNFNTITINV